MVTFDVNPHMEGMELLPDFFTTELSEEEREKYDQIAEKLERKNGGFIIPPEVNFRYGDKVTLDDVLDEVRADVRVTFRGNSPKLSVDMDELTPQQRERVKEIEATFNVKAGNIILSPKFKSDFESGELLSFPEAIERIYDGLA